MQKEGNDEDQVSNILVLCFLAVLPATSQTVTYNLNNTPVFTTRRINTLVAYRKIRYIKRSRKRPTNW